MRYELEAESVFNRMQRKSKEHGKALDSRNIGWFLHQKKICGDDEKIVIRNGWPVIEKKSIANMFIANVERVLRRWITSEKDRMH